MRNYRRVLLGAALVASGFTAGAQTPALFKIGAVEVRPSLAYDFTYDDNIFMGHSGGNKVEDFIHSILPGVVLGAGDYRGQTSAFFSAAYNADFQFFMDNDGANTTLHNGSLGFGVNTGRLGWRFDQTVVSQQDADVTLLAARGRLKRVAYTSALNGVYDLGDRSNLESSFVSVYNDFDSVNAFDSWRGQANGLLDYELTPKMHVGIGAAVGYDQVDTGVRQDRIGRNSIFEQGNVRGIWSASEKTRISAEVGVEFRQYQGVDVDKAFLRFGVGADWKATPLTVVSLNASRGTSPANTIVNQANLRTSIDSVVTHQLSDRYKLNAAVGYSMNDFFAVEPVQLGDFAAREDNYWFIRPSLGVKLMERAAANVFYQFARNDSDLVSNGNDFTNHRLGLNLSYSF
jgi:hypothetical protein